MILMLKRENFDLFLVNEKGPLVFFLWGELGVYQVVEIGPYRH